MLQISWITILSSLSVSHCSFQIQIEWYWMVLFDCVFVAIKFFVMDFNIWCLLVSERGSILKIKRLFHSFHMSHDIFILYQSCTGFCVLGNILIEKKGNKIVFNIYWHIKEKFLASLPLNLFFKEA